MLGFRDGTSVFPTASVPVRACDIDHNEPWPAETSAANTRPLHRRVHNLKTEGHLRLRQPAPGAFEWLTRTGHTYTRHRDPPPIAGRDTTPLPLAETPPDPYADDFAQMLAYLDAA